MPELRPDPERTLYLVDGTNNVFRAFYAIHGLRTSKGVPTNAVFGFTTMLRRLLREQAPRFLGVAFDLAGPTFRHAAYAEYKAHRPEAPADLNAQMPYVKRVCAALNVPQIELEGFEADDLIATLTTKARAAGFRVVIVATDKDLLQLVGEGVTVFNPVTEEFLDEAGVERAFGVKPAQVREVLALMGDASDNIPGVPGIGEKGAKELIRRHGDVEGVLAAGPTLARKAYREGLAANADSARLSRDLATVKRDVPVGFEAETLRLREPDAAAARELFLELEFAALAREFSAPVAVPDAPWTLITDPAALKRVVDLARRNGTFAFHLEGERGAPTRAEFAAISLAVDGDDGGAFYVPVRHHASVAPEQIGADEALEIVRPILEDPALRRVGDDVKTDLVWLRRAGVAPPGFEFDTMIASYLLNASRRSHALEVVAHELAGMPVPTDEALLGTGARRAPLAEADVRRAGAIFAPRAAAALAIRERLASALDQEGLLPLFRDVEMPLASVLADMERAGVRIDPGFLAGLAAEWDAELARLTRAIHALAGGEFNINSPRQIATILFETLGLKPGRRTQKTRSFSTDVETLEELAAEHELPRRLLEYRALQKLKSTYVDCLPALADAAGRVHTSFNQAVAATGRLSSSDPNLQNIPIRTEQGRQIRRAFIPADGHVFLSADYSQIELRILAHLCGDPALAGAFRAGEDIHRRTAAEVFGVIPSLVTSEMRRRAKVVNFGLLYGMGPQRLAREQGIPLKEAQEFIERYFQRLPRVKQYLDDAVRAAEETGVARTVFNRVRYFPEIRSGDRNARQQAIRAAVNTPLQGTAADLIKTAMVALAEALRRAGTGARMLLQVHDELVLEVPEDALPVTADLVRTVMEGAHPLSVPLAVDLRSGPDWLNLAPLERPAPAPSRD